MNIVKEASKKALSRISGKEKWQSFFEKMYFASLRGMNIGLGGNYATSGEKHILEIISNKLKNIDNIVVFDVGANLGYYSKMVNKIFGDKVRIFAFEPSKKTFNKMVKNTNDLKNISCYNFGFGNNIAKIKLYTDSDESGLASIYKRNLQHFNINMDQEEIVEIRTIDNFCSGGGITYTSSQNRR
jgi:FkbM family methyltransferase